MNVGSLLSVSTNTEHEILKKQYFLSFGNNVDRIKLYIDGELVTLNDAGNVTAPKKWANKMQASIDVLDSGASVLTCRFVHDEVWNAAPNVTKIAIRECREYEL